MEPNQPNPAQGLIVNGSAFQDNEANLIRVLFVAHDSALFGAQRTLLTLLQNIDRNRFSCRVVVPRDGEFVAEVERLNIPVEQRQMVRWVPEARVLSEEGRVAYACRLARGLRARAWAIAGIIERHKIDVVYTNTVVCVEGAIAAHMARVPHLWHVHEFISKNPELGAVFPVQIYARAIITLSKRVIFCSENLSAGFATLNSKACVVLNGIPVPIVFDRFRSRNELVGRLGLSAFTKIVTIIGAIHPRKDHSTFISAAALLATQRSDVAFLVAGSGGIAETNSLRESIELLGLGGRVHLLGWWHEPIRDLLPATDILVISSTQESFGLSAIEALAVETPVVATRCGGPEEIVRDGIDGFLVPVGGVNELAARISELLDYPERARELGRAGRGHVLAKFSVERYVAELQQVIIESAE